MEIANQTTIVKKPLFVICGPTATGKTDYALKLAKEKNGELISADSRQIYKYMDIGTGKDVPENSKLEIRNLKLEINKKNYSVGFYLVENIPLWLYDLITPDQRFSAFEYGKIAQTVIKDIWKRNKLPILVGGTGLYIKAVVDGIDKTTGPDWNLRKQLSKRTVEQLQSSLKSLNPLKLESMNHSDQNNPRRLIRALEDVEQKLRDQNKGSFILRPITNTINFIGLNVSREELYRRIDERVDKRVRQGVIEEIENLLKQGYSWNDPGFNTIGYKEWKPYFEGTCSKEEVVQKWKFAEHAYARRQLTWFNKDTRITWINGK